MAEEEKDDWLDDPSEDDSDELDQSDIDSLLSGDDSPAPEAAAEAAPEDEDEDEDELDQSDIDALLSGGDDPAPEVAAASAPADEDEDELDQSDIDALLSGGDDTPAEADAAPANSDEEDGEIDQSDIDALLSGDPASGQDDADISPDQEEIDRLFSEIDEDQDEADPFQAEEIDFEDILSEEEGGDESFLSTGNEFAEDEFDLNDDIPDIPDMSADDEETTIFEARDDDAPTPVSSDIPQDETVLIETEGAKRIDFSKFKLPFAVPACMYERKNQGIAAGCLVLLIAIAVFLFSGGEEEPQIAEVSPAGEQAESAPAVEAVNTAPLVSDQEYKLNNNEPVAIILTAQDAEGDELYYEILTQPQHGKLDGQAPNLVYMPNPDFPGDDSFDFRVNDGKEYSTPVMASIVGQKAVEQLPLIAEKPEPKIIKPRKLVVSAKSFSYSVTGTDDLYIDWENIWNDANYLPYSHQVAVEVLTDTRLGKLKKISNNMHRYNAKKYIGGKETIRYRFKLGKLRSKIKKITLTVNSGNPAPEIRMQEVARMYQPGEMVLLDASGSQDDDRNSLLFSWQQMAGVPVQLEVMNQEGSRVSFMMPSSFSNSASPGPVMRLTTIDKTGKTDMRDIKIQTQSRYKSALWGGLAGRN
jgi:hypothetical protein